MKPARSPNAARVYAYGPPGVALAVARWANTSARSTDPPVDTSHPARLIAPYGASDAGSRKTPDPIMLPMTSAVAIQNPSEAVSLRTSRGAAISITTGVWQNRGRGLDSPQGAARRPALPRSRCDLARGRKAARRSARAARPWVAAAAQTRRDSRGESGSLLPRRRGVAGARTHPAPRQHRGPGAHRAAHCGSPRRRPVARAVVVN